MRSSFRAKLILIVGTIAAAFAVVLTGDIVIGERQARDLSDVEGRLVPKLEMGPRLEAEFERLRQELQNAVSAQDAHALEQTTGLRDDLMGRLASAGNVIEPADAARLRWALNGYYALAADVSRRLIRGEGGDDVLAAVARMQVEQQKTLTLLKHATRLDRRELSAGFAAVRNRTDAARRFYLAIGLGALTLVMLLALWIGRDTLQTVDNLSSGFERFAAGNFATPIPVTAHDELGEVAKGANRMAESLRRLGDERDRRDWIKAGQAELSDELRGSLEPNEIAKRVTVVLVRRVGAMAGALYLLGDDGVLRLRGLHGLVTQDEAHVERTFRPGEGLVGRAAETNEIALIEDPPEGYLRIRSSLGEGSPRAVVLVPLARLGKVSAVVELALFKPCSAASLEFLSSIGEIVAVAIVAAQSRTALEELLEETRQQAERLTVQEEELRQSNQELQHRQRSLKEANDELQAQRQSLGIKNAELEEARLRVQQKADELARVSSYKSQFLANMSHELRTPLNSMLLLSHLLSENETRTLTQKQVEHCKTIHSAGQDLLTLINQVLDLAKIESGKQDVLLGFVDLEHLIVYAKRVFQPLATEKGLALELEVASNMPRALMTDQQRLERILTNLLGNAIKFTDRGEVRLRIARPAPGTRFERPELSVDATIAFAVSDTGIGIAPEFRDRVFAPFEQAESNTQRRYAGTGLGLAIARESAGLLGGELRLESEPGRGSTFICYLPEHPSAEPAGHDQPRATGEPQPRPIADDRLNLAIDDHHLLIIEDDPILAELLVDIVHARRLKALVGSTAQEGLQLAREHAPIGIILDVKLPDIDGWTVMERLSQDPTTRSIPVHFISAVDAPARGLSVGAIGYLTKPATRAQLASVVRALSSQSQPSAQRILVVEDSVTEATSIVDSLGREGFDARHVQSAHAAIEALEGERFGCLVLDLGLPDLDGLGFLQRLRARTDLEFPRVIVHTGRALTKNENRELEAYAEAVILKGGRSEERVLEEIRLFIGQLKDNLPAVSASVSSDRHVRELSLVGKKLLLAEDDMRTVYALSALLRGKGADVLVAENGREALEILAANPDVHGVLMDIMMPEMDGYEAIKRLRQEPRFEKLPVFALTARAMHGERERCLEAGANEYLTKPIDGDRLLATLVASLAGEGPDVAAQSS